MTKRKPTKDLRLEQAKREIAAVNKALKLGHPPRSASRYTQTAARVAGEALGESRQSFAHRIGSPDLPGMWHRTYGLAPDWSLYQPPKVAAPSIVPPMAPDQEPPPSPFAVEHAPPIGYTGGHAIELMSFPDNTYLFGAAGDLHAASKYTRWDVREDLYRWFIESGAQCNFDTGNWIDGEASFNRYDLEVSGLDRQIKLLAERHPKGLPTCAVWGDDHEGWYVQREGIDVGRYCENEMRLAGHDWTNMGFMEAHVLLKNANTGKTASMAVVHPGGGSAYATSYSIQKIIESLEGGEKPAVGLYGHYHKLWTGLIRNVWTVQTGTSQDQTPFMRKKRLEAHVGGVLVKLTQDPETGAITRMSGEMARYFNRDWYGGANRWSRHGSVYQPVRTR